MGYLTNSIRSGAIDEHRFTVSWIRPVKSKLKEDIKGK